MKRFAILILLGLRLTCAQDFTVAATSQNAIPVNSSGKVAQGSFHLDASLRLQGAVFIEDYSSIESMTVFRSTSALNIGSSLFSLNPGVIELPGPDGSPGGRAFDINRQILSSEAKDLVSGNWWLDVITLQFPNGEIRGQIIAVPEPNVSTLAFLGLFGFYLLTHWRRFPRAVGHIKLFGRSA